MRLDDVVQQLGLLVGGPDGSVQSGHHRLLLRDELAGVGQLDEHGGLPGDLAQLLGGEGGAEAESGFYQLAVAVVHVLPVDASGGHVLAQRSEAVHGLKHLGEPAALVGTEVAEVLARGLPAHLDDQPVDRLLVAEQVGARGAGGGNGEVSDGAPALVLEGVGEVFDRYAEAVVSGCDLAQTPYLVACRVTRERPQTDQREDRRRRSAVIFARIDLLRKRIESSGFRGLRA